ncbi:MAG: tyrosine-type recombinase/integrase [Cyclobacteriaceae bacterium]
MKKNINSFTIILRGDKINHKNQAPINFRLTRHRVPVYISSGHVINVDHWDGKKKAISNKHPNSIQLRNLLNERLMELNDQLFKIEREHPNLSSKEVKKLITENDGERKDILFEQIANDRIKKALTGGKIGTRDKLLSAKANFFGFLKDKGIRLWQIDLKLVRNYESFLLEKGLKESSIQSNIKFVRSILYLGYGAKEKVINNPFTTFKFKKLSTKRDFLTLDEFRLFESVQVNENSKMALHKDIFRFAVRGAGMRVSDLFLMRWRDIIDERIYFIAEKTDQPLSIKLTKVALSILYKYKTANSKASDFIFPIIDKGLDYSDKQALDSAISSATAYYNKNLKFLAEKAGINKRVSSHVGRHTMATLALANGMPITLIQRILGHADLKETMIYAKIINKDLDNAIEMSMNY